MPQPAQSAKQIAINVAKQTAREGNEFLKSAREQVASSPAPEQPKEQEATQNPQEVSQERQNLAKLRGEHSSFMQTYRGELEQIRRDNLFKELQAKISEGEEIPLEEYVKELSFEQREVLKAQIEAVKMRKAATASQKPQSLPQIVSKRARGMIQSAIKKRNQQPVETRQPPSS